MRIKYVNTSEGHPLLRSLGLKREQVLAMCSKMNPQNAEIYRFRREAIERAHVANALKRARAAEPETDHFEI